MFENPRRGRQARYFTTNAPKILDLKSSSEQIFSENCRWVPLILLDCSLCFRHPVESFPGSLSHTIQNYRYSRLASFLSLSFSNKDNRNSYTKKTKLFRYTKRQQITQTTQLRKTRPSLAVKTGCTCRR